ncbi:MAG: hypothetical protein KDI51_16850 [Xanthomonadales bacterium]|nr:hypothetical protein [Xanthomonadales bacterium]
MNPEIAPQFAQLCDRLRVVPWFSTAGRSIGLTLPFPCRPVGGAAAAKEAIEQPEWEYWTLERRNDLTSFLRDRFRNRYAGQWNKIADKAVHFLGTEVEPRVLPAIADAMPDSVVAVDAIRWDLAGALMEAAYADCRPPQFFTHLVTVYEAGHLPVGWDAGSGCDTLLVY